MNRYLATSLFATVTGSVLVFVAHGCAIAPFNSDYSEENNGYENAQMDRTGSSSSTGGGRGGAGGAGGSGGGSSCMCTADDNECTDDIAGPCPNGAMNACNTPVANRNCTLAGKAGYCDAAGTCTACDECSDAACTKRCNGQVCQSETVCVSGNCVDGYCCDSDCTGPCNACNRVPGTCSPLPAGMAGECAMGQLCGNGTGSCKDTTKKALGELCASMSVCESGTCVAQICVSPEGQPCAHDLECASNICDPTTNTCVSCASGVMCPGGASCLPSGRCQVLLGQPASNSSECIPPAEVKDNLTCTLPVNATCTYHFECIYHDCTGAPNGTCAGACAIDAECPSGTTCNPMGQCRLPPGSFCVIDEQCQGPVNAGKCGGFPRKCQ